MGRQILLIDDERPICDVLQRFLAEQGHEVRCANSAADALADTREADLAICDLRLGHDDGLALIGELRARRPELKVLVLTGYPGIEALQTATDLGVAGFLTKPLSLPELLASVDRALGDETGPFLLFPSTLKDKLDDVVPYLGEVTVADPPNWLRVRAQLRTAAPECVLVDGAALEAIDFFDACQRDLAGRAVFVMCRDEDFATVRQLLSRFPDARCLTLAQASGQTLNAIRGQLRLRREEAARMRAALAQQLSRCQYAAPLQTGYYCTITAPCPFGEHKEAIVTVRGRDHQRCPRRPFVIPDARRVGLLAWLGRPDERTIIDYRAQAMERLGEGKTHIIVDAQALEAAHFNLVELLADVEAALAERPEGRVDVVNLAPGVLQAFRTRGQILVGVQFHGRVLMELETRP